jgi:acetyltransferase-like isoleucine patch superfamily enzyme
VVSDGGTGTGRDSDRDRERRHERLARHPTPGRGNSMRSWADARSPVRVMVNYVLVWVARIAPSLRAKRWALRRLGASVDGGVAWALEATPDVFWPELITLREDCIVGYDAVLLCHEYLQSEYRTGEVVIGERAMVGAKAVVLPGVTVGADAQVAAGSLVDEDVPPGATVAGVPAEVVSGDGGPGSESGDGDASGAGTGSDGDDEGGLRS